MLTPSLEKRCPTFDGYFSHIISVVAQWKNLEIFFATIILLTLLQWDNSDRKIDNRVQLNVIWIVKKLVQKPQHFSFFEWANELFDFIRMEKKFTKRRGKKVQDVGRWEEKREAEKIEKQWHSIGLLPLGREKNLGFSFLCVMKYLAIHKSILDWWMRRIDENFWCFFSFVCDENCATHRKDIQILRVEKKTQHLKGNIARESRQKGDFARNIHNFFFSLNGGHKNVKSLESSSLLPFFSTFFSPLLSSSPPLAPSCADVLF